LTRLRAGGGQDRGITLIELVVAMTVTTIISAFAISFFVTSTTNGTKATLTNQATADARATLDSWTSLLRVAGWLDRSARTDRFEEITPKKIVFYANLNNLATADQTTGAPTKVALMLRVTNASTGAGQLIQVLFGSDNTTPISVRIVALDVTPTGGASQPIFQPYTAAGGPVDPSGTNGCYAQGVAQPGLCLQSPPAGAGMLDPQVGTKSLSVTSGPLRGNPSLNVDSTLQSIAGVNIVFTATDNTNAVPVQFTGSASVNSGFAS
jgi:prepilin-type N-terminal cleavage/methylation domain-containing protein